MTVKTTTGRKILNNVEELEAKRGVKVRFVYNIEDHKYIENGRIKYYPYTR